MSCSLAVIRAELKRIEKKIKKIEAARAKVARLEQARAAPQERIRLPWSPPPASDSR
jgi:hypothetical protein